MEKYSLGPETQLKDLDRNHVHEFFSLIDRNRSYLRQWLSWPDNIKSPVDLERYIDSTLQEIAEEKVMRAWIWHNSKIIGIVHLAEVDWVTRKAMIGYWIGQEYVGKGFATKATAAMINFAFNEWQLNLIEIRCALGNVASQKIPQKLGFKRDKILHDNEWLNGQSIHHIVYLLHIDDWKK